MSGTPQGSILSPILSNNKQYELVKYLLILQNNFEKGKSKRANLDWGLRNYRIGIEKDCVNKRKLLQQKFSLPSRPVDHPKFQRF
jgi:retron-type reverse transcriptase